MSNYLAIATVTAAFSQVLHGAAASAVPGATVTTGRPESMDNGTPAPGINIYLFQVTPNIHWRNADLPTRHSNGKMVQRPQTALDLHYLLTFYGNDVQLEPQRLLGSAVSAIHSGPILKREAIQATIDAAIGTDPNHYLADSDLTQQVETIKFSPLPLNLEELSKLWSVFFQTPYALSVTYRGSVVLIEGAGVPERALPVGDRHFDSGVSRQPVIRQLFSAAGANQPIVIGSTLVIDGLRLQAYQTQIRIGAEEMTPASGDVSDTRISLQLPPSLQAGVQGVQVLHGMMIGTPPVLRRSAESNLVPFVLRPSVTAVAATNVQGSGNDPRSADVTVHLEPTVVEGQRVTLFLNERATQSPTAYTFALPLNDTATNDLTIPISGVKAAEYLVRIQIDGAESPLTMGETGYNGTLVTIP